MDARIPDTPPIILPVSPDIKRPQWSVMIPVYNCISYLQETLESVLDQDPGSEIMQIEVVDDCSSDGDVQALVHKIGKGRVGYYRQENNRGSLRNFETCLNRSKGKWIHLLHGDDKVKPGFYQEIESLFNQYPQAGAAFTRHMLMDELGREYFGKKGPAINVDKAGILSNWLSQIARRNRLQPPAMVVKRSVYEQVGGFFGAHFGEDWEMWTRIAAHFPVAFSPKYLAVYRVHNNNITTQYSLSGQNVKDLDRIIDIIHSYLPEEEQQQLKREKRKVISMFLAVNGHKVFHYSKDLRAALHQANKALRMYRSWKILRIVGTLYLKCLFYWLHINIFDSKEEKPLVKQYEWDWFS